MSDFSGNFIPLISPIRPVHCYTEPDTFTLPTHDPFTSGHIRSCEHVFKLPSYLPSLPSFMGIHGITACQLGTITATGKGAMPEV